MCGYRLYLMSECAFTDFQGQISISIHHLISSSSLYFMPKDLKIIPIPFPSSTSCHPCVNPLLSLLFTAHPCVDLLPFLNFLSPLHQSSFISSLHFVTSIYFFVSIFSFSFFSLFSLIFIFLFSLSFSFYLCYDQI